MGSFVVMIGKGVSQPGFVDYPEVIAHYIVRSMRNSALTWCFYSDRIILNSPQPFEAYGIRIFWNACASLAQATRCRGTCDRGRGLNAFTLRRCYVVSTEHRYAGISSSKIRDVYSKMHHGLDGIPSDVQEAIPRSIASEIADSLLVDNNHQLKRSRKLVNFRCCWCHQRRQAR